jgi:cytidine diphosphoramidate kinase
MVIWITGLSGVGKTTLANAIYDRFKPEVPELIRIDGDEIRELFGGQLGHTLEDRLEQLRRIQIFAGTLQRQNMLSLVSVLYADPEILASNRENLPEYLEVYLKAPLSLVERRDTKGLYAKARSGEISDVVGVDIDWIEPSCPDVTIDASVEEKPEQLALEIARYVPRLARLLEKE